MPSAGLADPSSQCLQEQRIQEGGQTHNRRGEGWLIEVLGFPSPSHSEAGL